MKLSPKMRSILVSEINFAIDKMLSTQNPMEKLYYFSAVYGAVNRVMNIEFDPELTFILQVTNSSYNVMITNLKLIKEGQMVITFEENLFTKLENSLKQLANNIDKD